MLKHFMLILILLSFCVVSQAAITDGLVLYFPFNEGTGNIIQDGSGNDNNGMIIKGTKWVDGKYGKGLYFNGSGSVEVPHSKTLEIRDEISIMLWILPELSGSDWQGLVTKGDDGKESFELLLNNYGFFHTGWRFAKGRIFPDRGVAGTIVKGEWQHLALTYKPGEWLLYVNGVLIDRRTDNDQLTVNNNPLVLGDEKGSNRFFSGTMDEVAIFNRAISQNEVKLMMNTSINKFIKPLKTISIASTKVYSGSQFTTQLDINDAVGITSGDITIQYDPNVLSIVDIKPTNLTSNMNLTTNKSVPGQIKIVMAGTNGMTSGSGSLADITITANADAKVGSETILHFISAELYDEAGKSIPINIEDGTIKIIQSCVKGDVNNDGNVKSNDATLILRIAAGLLEPNDYQKCAADVNSDGKIRSNDATIVLRKAAGLEAPVRDFIADRHINISLSETHGLRGETVSVPITVDNADILSSGDMSISYDGKVLRAIDILSSDGLLMANNISQPGLIRISFAGVDRLNYGKLAEIKFEVLTDDVSPLTFKMAELYGTDALPLNSKFTNKQFRSWAVAPELSALLQNYPNPFNPETWIPYQLHEANEVVIRIHNVSGELVRELRLGYKSAGQYMTQDRSAYWDGRNEAGERVSSGVYFYNIQAGNYNATMKMIVKK
jgi:hypothetical protein